MKTVTELRADRERHLAEIDTLATRNSGTDVDTWPAGDRQRAENLYRAIDRIDDSITEMATRAEKLDHIERGLNGGHLRTESGSTGPDVFVRSNRSAFENLDAVRGGMVTSTDLVARARLAVETAPEHMSDDAREHVTRMLDALQADGSKQAPLISRHLLLTGSPDYHREFVEYHQTGYVGEAMRTAMSLTDGNGGYLVPFTLDPTIILTNQGVKGNIREISRVEKTATDTWSGVTSSGVTAEWAAEAAEAADASPTTGLLTITPKRADAWIQGSYEVLSDSGFASQLGRLLTDAKVRLEEAAFATANTGATKPRGVLAAVAAVTASLVTSATTGAFVVGDVYNVASAIPPRFEDNATWLCNKAIANKIRQFDTAGGGSFWANLGMGQPEQLLGQPIFKNSTMTGTVANAALVLLCGDFREYVIVDRIGLQVAYEPMIKGSNRRPTGEAGWFAWWRVGADVSNPDAFRALELNQTAAAVALS